MIGFWIRLFSLLVVSVLHDIIFSLEWLPSRSPLTYPQIIQNFNECNWIIPVFSESNVYLTVLVIEFHILRNMIPESNASSEPCQTSNLECFAEIVIHILVVSKLALFIISFDKSDVLLSYFSYFTTKHLMCCKLT